MEDLLKIGFGSVLSILGTVFVFQFRGIRCDLKAMSQSVGELNNKLAVVINDQEWHKEELKDLKDRVHDIENVK